MKYTMSDAALAARRATGLKRYSRVPFTCPGCGQTVMMERGRAPKAKYCSLACYHRYGGRAGSAHPLWRGGRNVGSHGYVLVYAPGHVHADARGRVKEHILVAERALGKALPAGAVVHHINGNRGDNRASNLVICQSQPYHLLLHARARVVHAGGQPTRHKFCSHCQALKVRAGFFRDTDTWDGLRSICRACTAARRKKAA